MLQICSLKKAERRGFWLIHSICNTLQLIEGCQNVQLPRLPQQKCSAAHLL